MDGIVKTGLVVAAAVATTNRRFEVAWEPFTGPFAKRPKHKRPKRKRPKRKPHHYRLTRISSIDEGQEVVLHPLTT